MTAVIETSGLSKAYRRVTALSDCTLSVPEGRISALVGPNGAGKTTLLRLLAGLAAPTGGRAAVLGGPPREDPAYLAEIGFLAQEIPVRERSPTCGYRWTGRPARCREDSAPSSRSRSPWPNGPGCCCWTSRSPRSTRWPGAASSRRWPRPRQAGT